MKLGSITLEDKQELAMRSLTSGKVLLGGVGSGKTYTSIFWAHANLSSVSNKTIHVITTAMKRDLIEAGKDKPDWQSSLEDCGITDYVVDSWNNVDKYIHIKNSLFIFDEQRVVGTGKWAKSFITIAHNNKWVLCSATPGDTYLDYLSIFLANGFYRNKTDFVSQHIEYDRFAKYPKVKAFHNKEKLEKLRKSILVPMTVLRHTTRKREDVFTQYDKDLYNSVANTRWDYIENAPIENASRYTQLLRRVTSTSQQRIQKASEIMFGVKRLIVFYNYDYERDILLNIATNLGKTCAEWNGHNHEPVPLGDEWIYLVQYTAGSEGWNCITTDSILFYSPNYSYKVMEQAEGRIDRSNTPYKILHYYNLTSNAKIDKDIKRAVLLKKRFNEAGWASAVSAYFKKDKPRRIA